MLRHSFQVLQIRYEDYSERDTLLVLLGYQEQQNDFNDSNVRIDYNK